MMTVRSDFELMAPAGSYESLVAAVQGGADSVYFGVDQLNMRAHAAGNFTFKDINGIAEFTRNHNIKAYITLNTVVYDEEIRQVHEIIDKAKEAGINAVIASDLAVIQYATSAGMPVHASTQLNISNIEAVRFFANYCDVIVLARELNIDQIKNICQSVKNEYIHGPSGKPLRIEVFIHGALCMAISGKCYLSLHQYNQAANRGKCYQTCRRSYNVTDKETGYQLTIDNEYIMSPKDLCTLGFFDQILQTGAQVFKIEGRARGPEYVKRITWCYNEAINHIISGKYSDTVIDQLTSAANEVFNRGFWEGYYMGKTIGEWSNRYGSQSTKRKEYIARATNYFSKLKVAEFKIETGQLKKGDKVIITGPTTGVIELEINEIHNNHGPVSEVKKGEYFSIPVPVQIRKADKLYLWVDNQ